MRLDAGGSRNAQPVLVSLFSGAGGMDLGLARNGWRIRLACEILREAAETYSRNFGLPLHDWEESPQALDLPAVVRGDAARVDFRVAGHADAVVGGPPCQDFSVVRGPEQDRRGLEVERGRLYMHFVRALAAVQPKIFVFENVPGLLSANRGLAYHRIFADLRDLRRCWLEIRQEIGDDASVPPPPDYEVVFARVVNAADVGVPQSRKRLILIGVRRDILGGHFLEATWICDRHLLGLDMLFRKYPLTPLEVFEGRPLPELRRRYAEIMQAYADILPNDWGDVVEDYIRLVGTEPASAAELERAFEQHEQVLRHLGYAGRPVYEVRPSDGSAQPPQESPQVLRRMRMIPPGENISAVRGGNLEAEGLDISLMYRRLHPLKPAYTVVAYGGGGTWGYHYERNRSRLTNRERARLQTFPDEFLFSGTSQQQRAQIGEAVPPLLAESIARACWDILELCGETPSAESPLALVASAVP
jgi:DNA (cytosine-5)-methyltransferase 1